MIDLETIYIPSDDIVARELDGELIIVPLTSGIGDMEDELYTLNDIGKEVWKRLDGKTSLGAIVTSLAEEYEAATGEIAADALGFVAELARRRMLVAVGH